MEKTITEKIFSRACRRDVRAGEFVLAPVDLAMANDITAPLAVKTFREIVGDGSVWDPGKIVIVLDHQSPADSVKAAENHKMLREFAREQGIIFYDVGEGIAHQIMVERYIKPGMLVVGADSHTCTYGALGAFATGVGSTDIGCVFALGKLWFRVPDTIKFVIDGKLGKMVYGKDIILKLIGIVSAHGANYKTCEFCGEVIKNLGIDQRLTICNMAVEMGAKTGIIEPDAVTIRYLKEIGMEIDKDDVEDLKSDENAQFERVIELNVTGMSPQVAKPHRVDNVVDVEEVEGIRVDQIFIGSCTNGRFEDLKICAEILDGERIARNVRLIVIPASRREYIKALRQGVIEKLVEAGAIVEFPCCGPCMGSCMGLIASGEVSLSTSNRNFIGRQGSPEGQIYLCSPATAAASAIYGEITDPRKV